MPLNVAATNLRTVMALRRTVTQFQRRVLQARYLQASRHPDRAPKTKRSESDHDRVGEGKYESGHTGVGIRPQTPLILA